MIGNAPASRYAEEFMTGLCADLQRFADGLRTSADLAAFLADDARSLDEKRQLVREVFAESLDPFSLQLVLLVIEQGQSAQLPQLAASAAELLHRWRDMLTVRMTTAQPLSAEEEQSLRHMLQQQYGKEIMLEKVVDADLIGGAVLKIGDKLYDGSIKSQLQALEKELLK